MKSTKPKQISIQLPIEVVQRAAAVAKKTQRSDGLKQTKSATLRAWLLKGMETSTNV